MATKETIFNVADNSGPNRVKCIKILGRGGDNTMVSIGHTIIASVRQANSDSKIKAGALVRCVVVRTRSELRRDDGTQLKFSDNAVVVLTDSSEMAGTRVFGVIPRELKEIYPKIVTLSKEVI